MAKKDKVACQYCGKEYHKSGVANHEKSCSENPENQVEEIEEVEEIIETEEVVAEEPKEEEAPKEEKEELVKIKLADKIECYIGNKYYRYKKGDEDEVPVNVKDVLKRAGLLEAI